MASVALPTPSNTAAENANLSSETEADKIEVLQRSASVDISYALLQEGSQLVAPPKARGGTTTGRSRSSNTAGQRRRPSSPLARALTKRVTSDDGEDAEYDSELRALNRRWQELLVQDVEKLRGPIKTTKSRSAGTDQDDDTIQVKNSAVNYKPSVQKAQQGTPPANEQFDHEVYDNEEEEVPVEDIVLDSKRKNTQLKNDEPVSTDTSTSSASSGGDRYSSVSKPPVVTPKRNRFFSLLGRKKAEEEKRFAEIIKQSDQSTSTVSGFFSNKKQPWAGNVDNSKRKHFSLTPFPTPPRDIRPVSPPTPKMVVMKRAAASDVSTMTTSTVTPSQTTATTQTTTTSKTTNTSETKPVSVSRTSVTESSADEILRDLSLSSSASTSSSHGPVSKSRKAISSPTSSVAPTKAQIAAAIANPEKSLKRARRYRKEATRLLHTVSPDDTNPYIGCAAKEDSREFQGRAKKAYQYAAEARRLYDILEKADQDLETKEKDGASLLMKNEQGEGPSSAQSCSSEETHTDSTTFSEKLAREELQSKLKELELFSEFKLAPKLPLACSDRNTEDQLGTIYVAEAHRIMGTFSQEELEDSMIYASPVPSYEEMSIMSSGPDKTVLEEHKARMAELQLFTTETITSSLQNSIKRAAESMGLLSKPKEETPKNGLFRGQVVTTNENPGQITRIDTAEDNDDAASVTSADPRFRGYTSSCQLTIEDDGSEGSCSTTEEDRTIKSGKQSVISNDDDSSAGNVSQSLYTVDEDDGSSDDDDDQSNGDTTYSEGDDNESVGTGSGSSDASDSTDSQSDYSSQKIAKAAGPPKSTGFSGWIRGV